MSPEQQRIHSRCQAFKAWLEKQDDMISKAAVRKEAESIFLAVIGKRPDRRKKKPAKKNDGIPITYIAQQAIYSRG